MPTDLDVRLGVVREVLTGFVAHGAVARRVRHRSGSGFRVSGLGLRDKG